MKDGYQYVGVGAFFLVGVGLLFLTYSSLTSDLQEKKGGYEIVARFDDLLQLRRGDQVRMSGVIVGVVVSTALEGRDAVARLSIDPRYEIPADSSAIIRMAGLLGTNYISIDMGGSGTVLAAGDAIRTRESFDINDALEEVGDIATSVGSAIDGIQSALGGGESDDSVFGMVEQLLRDNGENLTRALGNISRISGQIAEGEGTVGKLIYEDGAYAELLKTAGSIQEAAERAETLIANADGVIAEAGGVFEDVRAGGGLLGTLIYDDGIGEQVRTVTSNLASFSEKLNHTESTVSRLLTEDDLYIDVRSVVRKANRTLDSLSDSAPISAVGVAAGALF